MRGLTTPRCRSGTTADHPRKRRSQSQCADQFENRAERTHAAFVLNLPPLGSQRRTRPSQRHISHSGGASRRTALESGHFLSEDVGAGAFEFEVGFAGAALSPACCVTVTSCSSHVFWPSLTRVA